LKDNPKNGFVINKEKSGWVKKNNEWLKPLKFLGMSWFEELGRLIWTSATRAGKSLAFDKHSLFSLALDRETGFFKPQDYNESMALIKKVTTHEAISRDTLDQWWKSKSSDAFTVHEVIEKLKEYLSLSYYLKQAVKGVEVRLAGSGLFGFVQSRMYQGQWNYDTRQDFTMGELTPNSWAWIQRKRRLKFTIYNSSTFATDDLLRYFRSELPVLKDRKVIKTRRTGYSDFSFFTKIWDTRSVSDGDRYDQRG
jgi:hypothetical protein